jgi:hypothetical protein
VGPTGATALALISKPLPVPGPPSITVHVIACGADMQRNPLTSDACPDASTGARESKSWRQTSSGDGFGWSQRFTVPSRSTSANRLPDRVPQNALSRAGLRTITHQIRRSGDRKLSS